MVRKVLASSYPTLATKDTKVLIRQNSNYETRNLIRTMAITSTNLKMVGQNLVPTDSNRWIELNQGIGLASRTVLT